MNTQMMAISKIKANPNNPRIIKDDKFAKLVNSIKEFPEMLQARPIVVSPDLVVLGGNMRLKALQEAGIKEAPVYVASWEEAKQREFIIKDNVGFGEWDWDMLANEWDADKLDEWGLDVPVAEAEEDDTYTKKIESPLYEPKDEKPTTAQLYDTKKHDQLVSQINAADFLTDEEKQFLLFAAKRHVVFDYEKIAEYYAHSSEAVQELMEQSALVIIDFSQAIEDGYAKLSKQLLNQYADEYGD